LKVGGDIIPKGYLDLTRFVKWPHYVRIQRQKRVLLKRLRVPPAIAQFTRVASKPLAARIVKFLENYKPEDEQAKKKRLREAAANKDKAPVADKKPKIRHGINEVVRLVETQKAQLVVLPHDVDPVELVVFLPALCKKLNVPYVIVKSKSRLGQLVHRKGTAALAITDVRKEDKEEFAQIIEAVKGGFNDKFHEINRQWGGTKLSKRSRFNIEKANLANKEN